MDFNKRLSCGVLIVDKNENLLMLHATGQTFWDLPKGTQDEGESPIETATRELKEETGLTVDSTKLIELGWYEYNKFKDLFLFLLPVEEINLSQLRCDSYFFDGFGQEQPEADDFALVPIAKAGERMCKSMARLFEDRLERDLHIMLGRAQSSAA